MKILVVTAIKAEYLLTRNDVSHIVTGVGIPNSIYSLTKHMSDHTYDLVVNIGICGSFTSKYNIGTVVEVINDSFSEIGYEDDNGFSQFTNDFDIKTSFNSNQKTDLECADAITVNTVNNRNTSNYLGLLSVDIESMEGASIMMVCEKFNTPSLQIRGVSNFVEERNKKNWNIPLAISNSNHQLDLFLSNL
ncbi:MAG: futalosine hydrolase [Flavobacteriales bacterium]|nr:futalosine hydrolase [Flavobacteriales bacterium]|tara:strand:+ start:400 stop:972 length:573 start_codon:yes stop_codon:yes gene_type:complete